MNKKNKIYTFFYDFLDNKVADSSIVVGIIGFLIIIAGYFGGSFSPDYNNYYKSNILEQSNFISNEAFASSTGFSNVIEINGSLYKVTLEKIN